MLRRWRRRRSRRRGVTTVEYALMLALVAIAGIFGVPKLVETSGRMATAAGDGIETVGEAP